MSGIVPFLEYLGLDQSAAASDVRRAYARKLKLIDQERDAAGFQRLREAYEAALEWVRHGVIPAEPEARPEVMPRVPATMVEVAPSLPLVSEAAGGDPDVLASEVFDGLMADCMAMMRSQVAPELARWEALLAHALGHRSLLNLRARQLFEARMVQVLAAGWGPGHEFLLVAAARVFGWNSDGRRLSEFGRDGALLSRALIERAMFDAQPEELVLAQREVVALLRKAGFPCNAEMSHYLRHAEVLEARFPTWLALVTDVSKISMWRRQLAPGRNPAQVRPAAGKVKIGWGVWVILLLVLNLIRMMFQA